VQSRNQNCGTHFSAKPQRELRNSLLVQGRNQNCATHFLRKAATRIAQLTFGARPQRELRNSLFVQSRNENCAKPMPSANTHTS